MTIVNAHVAGVINLQYVESGVRVEQGEKLLSIESMKMMFDVLAPAAGVVKYFTRLGAVVARGQKIAEII